MRPFRPFFLNLFLGVLAGLLVGCGGGETAATTGRAVFSLVWPAPSRLIPQASNSIRVEIRSGTTAVASQVLSRPVGGGPANITFGALPIGDLTATATGYPQVDGTGIAQASATVPLKIQAGQDTVFQLTMASTIDHLELTPVNPTVVVGQTLALTATAKDRSGNIVLLSSTALRWERAGGNASVNAQGVVTGLTEGSATVTVRDTESGKSASVPVTVQEQRFLINGQDYIASGPLETLIAVFTQSDGGVSTATYTGYILLHVAGVGQSDNQVFNDAFYRYTDHFANAPNRDFFFYQLAFGTSPLPVHDPSVNAIRFLVGSLPPYNPAHEYTIILNTGLTTPGRLHFGVSDGGFSDNSGAYTIEIKQLVPAP